MLANSADQLDGELQEMAKGSFRTSIRLAFFAKHTEHNQRLFYLLESMVVGM